MKKMLLEKYDRVYCPPSGYPPQNGGRDIPPVKEEEGSHNIPDKQLWLG